MPSLILFLLLCCQVFLTITMVAVFIGGDQDPQ
ncbi:hypothetical protein SHLI107390_19740 [Shewanella livingstonensis]